MARSRRKHGGCTRNRYKRKKMGKGWLAGRAERGGSRPVLRITETDGDAQKDAAKS